MMNSSCSFAPPRTPRGCTRIALTAQSKSKAWKERERLRGLLDQSANRSLSSSALVVSLLPLSPSLRYTLRTLSKLPAHLSFSPVQSDVCWSCPSLQGGAFLLTSS